MELPVKPKGVQGVSVQLTVAKAALSWAWFCGLPTAAFSNPMITGLGGRAVLGTKPMRGGHPQKPPLFTEGLLSA